MKYKLGVGLLLLLIIAMIVAIGITQSWPLATLQFAMLVLVIAIVYRFGRR